MCSEEIRESNSRGKAEKMLLNQAASEIMSCVHYFFYFFQCQDKDLRPCRSLFKETFSDCSLSSGTMQFPPLFSPLLCHQSSVPCHSALTAALFSSPAPAEESLSSVLWLQPILFYSFLQLETSYSFLQELGQVLLSIPNAWIFL